MLTLSWGEGLMQMLSCPRLGVEYQVTPLELLFGRKASAVSLHAHVWFPTNPTPAARTGRFPLNQAVGRGGRRKGISARARRVHDA